jgi:Ca2+-transporting ATPase
MRLQRNPWMLGAIAFAAAAHMMILYTPLNALFELAPLTLQNWLFIGGIAAFGILILESAKKVLWKRG